ncbi:MULTISPECIES: hypothetical protein [unclassified Aureimonas]|uniref:hypothetical protein n=1 Tax=unclassified Aureimonas TaxID=2615206 RepID=UPI0006F206DA|nr:MULTISPECIES: hypothetical protein [unclassified Aureimonas]KQT66160.1 hypothetical protein ASG62_20400 [Aureimonas sp. Leaf427]KQT73405.1 hypothetical protein ASG54_17785 [Aureimonas sp. Leaf460]
MKDRRSDDGFLAELEQAAKGLSLVTDRASQEELQRLFGELQDDGRRSGDAPGGAVEVEFGLHGPAEASARRG